MSETIVRCPKCGEPLRLTVTPAPKGRPDRRVAETPRRIQAGDIIESKVELESEPIEWKPWKSGTGEWVNMLEATELFSKIQKAGGQLEHGGYRYWIFGSNGDMIARKKSLGRT